jgi:hypothetical protein
MYFQWAEKKNEKGEEMWKRMMFLFWVVAVTSLDAHHYH